MYSSFYKVGHSYGTFKAQTVREIPCLWGTIYLLQLRDISWITGYTRTPDWTTNTLHDHKCIQPQDLMHIFDKYFNCIFSVLFLKTLCIAHWFVILPQIVIPNVLMCVTKSAKISSLKGKFQSTFMEW